jgi:uncharacterized membrane protein
MMDYWPLLGIALVVLGFALRFNPLLVVAVAAIATGLLGHMPFLKVLGVLGHGFNESRTVTLIYIVLPVIGLLERYGLQQQARTLISGMRGATVGRLLIVYMAFRQIFAALGLTSVAGQAQTVRPLVAPMALAAAEKEHGALDEETAERVKAMSAATDNVGLFFGEDIFIAVSSILLIQGILKTFGVELTPFELSVWAIPTAVCAFVIQSARLLWLDRQLAAVPRRKPGSSPEARSDAAAPPGPPPSPGNDI